MRLKNNWMVVMTGLVASLLASALLLNLYTVFAEDWTNHLWLIEYFGASIKHLCIPDMVNTKQLIGIPDTLFYGQKFYALLGMFSAFLGSAVTVRGMVFMVFLLQFFHVYRAAMKFGCARNIAIGIAVVMTGVITKFFSVALLTCCVSSFLCVIIHDRQKPVPRYDIIAAGLFFVLIAMTHPLTALFGGLFLGILGSIALIFCERTRRLWLLTYFAITALLSLLVLSPCLYVFAQFNNKSPIAYGFAKDTFSNEVPVIFRNFEILDGNRFGQIGSLTVNLSKAAIVVTNIQPFPWNRILINGSLQSTSDVMVVAGREAVLLPSGSYILKAVNRIDGVWKFLNLLSWVLLLGWIAVYTGCMFIKSQKAIGFVKKYAPYFLMVGSLFFAYYPVLTGYYLHTDDYAWSQWGGNYHIAVKFTSEVGRPLAGLLYSCSVCIGQLAGMNLFRFLSVCNLCFAAFLLSGWLCSYKLDRWFSSFLSAAVFTLPPFQVYASYLSTAPFGIAVTLSILALILVDRRLYAAAILLLVMAFALYQPSACFYLTLLCVPFLMEKDIRSFAFWRKIFICLLVFAGAVLLYYLPWRLWLQLAAVKSCGKYDGRLLVSDLGQRWIWFIKGPFVEASNFWNIHPLTVVSYVFIGFLVTALLCRARIKNLGFDLLRGFVVLLLVPISFFVVLVSSAPSMEYRTYSALSATLLLVGGLSLVFSEKVKYRLVLGGLTFLVMIGGACWAHITVENYFAVPDSKEIRYIIQSIREAQQNGQADFSGVALVMPRHPVAPDRRNEIGEPSTTAPQNVGSVLMTAFNELGINKKNIRVDCFEDMENLYLHEYGVVSHGESFTPKMVYRQDLIIDMNKIDD